MLHFDRTAYRFALCVTMSLLWVAGCGEKRAGQAPDGVDALPPVDGDGASEFVSHVAGESVNGNRAESGAGGSGASAPAANAGADMSAAPAEDAGRVIAEADIIQIQGDRLFALSAYGGLSVVDVSDPTRLRVLGRYRTAATPFEMYLKDQIAYVMFNGYYSYEFDEASGAMTWVSSARMQALDVGDPAHIVVRGDHEIPGNVSDSRLVGNVLYLVTFQDGYCWRCDDAASTRVASFNIADPSQFPLVDELRFEADPNSWGARSISVTDARMYVAGPNWSDANAGSTIQVVDISDAGGKLALGAEVRVAGVINNRWQMDEYDGVLRVISQPGGWRSSQPPVVETFGIQSTTAFTALGSLQMRLPRAEDLQSVRFDGQRAYAITFEQTDPLFTLDLSDPAVPEQVGELEIPGFVYHMEPRGDRVYALGFDRDNPDGGMHVSIFDVSDLSAPVMLDRVNFGSQWANAVEDQDRIHKAFNIMLDQGLILVPFAGGEYEQANCSYQYQSGIQIIDVAADDLTLRGQAPQLGTARRSLLHEGALIGISDDSIQTFDISDRDAPKPLGKLEVARNIESLHLLGDRILRFGNDWWTDRTLLDFTTKADANAAQPAGELDLGQVFGDEANSCGRSSYWGGEVLVHGDTAYVARHVTTWGNGDGDDYTQGMTIYVIDISSDMPVIASSFEVESAHREEWLGSMVLTDSALLIGRGHYRYYGYSNAQTKLDAPKFYYDIFSLEQPRAPRYIDRFEVPGEIASGGWGYGVMGCGLDMGWGWWRGGYDAPNTLVDGDILVSQHEEALDDGSGRVKYYLDRLDLSDPTQPRMLAPVNIPGKVVHFDGAAGVIVTIEDDLRELAATDYQDCYWRGSRATFDPNSTSASAKGTCRIYDRLLNTLRLEGDKARRISQLSLDQERNSQSIAVSDDRVFVLSVDRVAYDWQHPVLITPMIHSYGVGSDGALRVLGDIALRERQAFYGWFDLVARGKHAFVEDTNQLHVVTAPDASAPTLVTHDMPGWSCNSLQVDAERVFCAMGKQGVLVFDL